MLGYVAASTRIVDGHCNVYVANKNLGNMVIVLQYFLPIIVFFAVYWQIAFVLKNRVNPGSKERKDTMHGKMSRNIIVTLIKVVLCFVVCWSPNQIYYFLYLLNLIQMDFQGIFYHFSVVLIFCNCCCNPIVYALNYKNFRAGAAKLFGCKNGKNRLGQSANSSSLQENPTVRE
ncbi:hypothetical protein CAPTEDRAFT_201792 [Capitella teleta]|nr:hypothetical protein CAPTEDRAFT_201792 [Capitella teleta]|eukprot:ELU03550.1 hypothetical protein CAPTEDRAFT_201792 [Capitella teleta]